MTATLTIKSGVGYGSTSVDLGTIEAENESGNTGLNLINKAKGKSDERKEYPTNGSTRIFNISGHVIGTATTLRTFTNLFKLIMDYHQNFNVNSTFKYANTTSNIYAFYNGVNLKLNNYNVRQDINNKFRINYSINVQEVADY